MTRCIGRHWDDRDPDFDDGPAPAVPRADYFRECSWCGATVHLCFACLARIFLCARCFRYQRVYGKEKARAMGEARERRRARDRRRRLLRRSA